MAEEIKPIIKVDTGESQRTVKALKKDISDLKDQILNLTKGTKEYDDAVDKLQQSQRELNEVQALTKRTATALEGSYDALTHQMSLLKKEWRATADEARRADLGAQIDEINGKLKEMDASVGNFQRNVGNYVSHWEGMPEVTKDFGAAMKEMNERIEPTKQQFESVGKIASGLASGFAAVQGAAALLGLENENLERTLVKVQAAMAIAQGIGGLGGLVEGLGKAKVAFQGVINSIKATTAAMSATGWLAVIVAVSAAIVGLVSWIKKTKDSSEDLTKQLEKQNAKFDKMGSNVASSAGKFELFRQEYSKLGTEAEKKQWIDENAQAFSSLGLAINDVNSANKTFLEDSDKIITALQLQAEAAALSSIYQEEYGKAYAEQRKIEQKALAYKKGYSPTAAERKEAGLVNETDFNSTYHSGIIDEAPWWQKGILADAASQGAQGIHSYTEYHSDVNEAGAAKLQEMAKAQKEAVWAEANAVMADYLAKQREATAAARAAGLKSTTTTTTPPPPPPPLPVFDDNIEIADEPIVVEDSSTKIQKEGEYFKRVATAYAAVEKTYSDIARKNREDIADYEVTIEERKLAHLKELHQQSIEAGDYSSQLLIAQEIADQEIAIEEAKYAQMYRLREEYATKTANAIAAASQITQGILEITQAAYEKDEEITKKEAKRIKGLQIAIATMNMLQGITTALAGCFTTKTGPWDIALATAQAVSIAAAGTANIMKIRNTDLTGSVSSGAMGAVTPNSNVFGTDIPFSYTRNVTGQSEVDSLNEPVKVYVTESDITDAVNKSKVRVEEASF